MKPLRCITVFILLTFTLLSGCYLPKTLYYQFPDLDDYKHFRNRTLETSGPQPWPLAAAYGHYQIPDSCSAMLKAIQTTAFVIICNDSIVYEQYWEDGGSETLSNSFSMSKTLVATLIGFAIQDGYIKSLEQPVYELIPGFGKHGKDSIRIVDVLTMSSGIEWKEGYSGLFGPLTRAYYGRNLERMVMKLKKEISPGKTYRYQSISTQILALALEKATGKTLSEYATEKLWQPLGAEHPAQWSLDRRNGDEKSYCCLHATARDFARLGLFWLHYGNWKGRQLLSEDYLRSCFTPCSHLSDTRGNPVTFYGYHCLITEYEGLNVMLAVGLGGQYIIAIPEKNVVIVRLGHRRTQYQGYGLFPKELLSAIAAGISLSQ